jgi:hypothetical protein
MREYLWWFLYTVAGVWLQRFFPGLDFFLPGLVLCLQLRRYHCAFWFGLAWILIQEGSGTLTFGACLLWYMTVVIVFFGVRFFFSTGSFVFVLLLSLFVGLWHAGVVHIMAVLQEIRVDSGLLLLESLKMALVFPITWGVLYVLRMQVVADRSHV